MKLALTAAGLALAAGSAAVLFLAFAGGRGADRAAAVPPTHTPAAAAPTPTPLPRTWPQGLRASRGGTPVQLSCLDRNGDGRLSASDGADLAGVDIVLAAGTACADPEHRADYYAGPPADTAAYRCDAPRRPALLVSIASAGSNLLDPTSGESMGLIDIIDALQARTAEERVGTDTVLATSAVFGAETPQTAMEQWLAAEVARRLDAMPCLRAVIIGHSHGGATVTSVTAALDGRYAARLFGVAIDRTTALYDRPATEMPARTPLLNVYQTNEGWHGVPLALPNVTDVDASTERAPIAPSDGGGGLALVSHKTLDDAPAVQQRVVDAVMAWLSMP